MQKLRLTFRILIGNVFEHYDTALFSFLIPFIAPQFFGLDDPLVSLIKGYALIPLGVIAKPLGSAFFGWIGDTFGHKKALSFSLYGMALSSLLFCIIPSYESIGIFSAVLLSFLRLFQTFFAAGEHIGGAICLLEDKDTKEHSALSSLYSSSTILGIIFASAATTFLAQKGLLQQQWRFLYLLGALTAVAAASIPIETLCFKKGSSSSFQEHLSLLRKEKRAFFYILIASGFSYSCYSIAFIASLALLPFATKLPPEECTTQNTILLFLDFLLFPLFACFSNKLTSFSTMKAAALGTALLGTFLFASLKGVGWIEALILRFFMVFLGVAFSAYFHAWSLHVAPDSSKQTTISLAYSIGSQIFGASTALITLILYKSTHSLVVASSYWVMLAFATAYCIQKSETLFFLRKKIYT
jgi:MHS family proline/betaine transporter-like MFS transporter